MRTLSTVLCRTAAILLLLLAYAEAQRPEPYFQRGFQVKYSQSDMKKLTEAARIAGIDTVESFSMRKEDAGSNDDNRFVIVYGKPVYRIDSSKGVMRTIRTYVTVLFAATRWGSFDDNDMTQFRLVEKKTADYTGGYCMTGSVDLSEAEPIRNANSYVLNDSSAYTKETVKELLQYKYSWIEKASRGRYVLHLSNIHRCDFQGPHELQVLCSPEGKLLRIYDMRIVR